MLSSFLIYSNPFFLWRGVTHLVHLDNWDCQSGCPMVFRKSRWDSYLSHCPDRVTAKDKYTRPKLNLQDIFAWNMALEHLKRRRKLVLSKHNGNISMRLLATTITSPGCPCSLSRKSSWTFSPIAWGTWRKCITAKDGKRANWSSGIRKLWNVQSENRATILSELRTFEAKSR